MTPRRTRTITGLLVLLAVVGATVPGAVSATTGDAAAVLHTETVVSADGTRLAAQVWRPAGLAPATRTPVVLMVTPYAAPGVVTGDRPQLLPAVMSRGWTLAQVSLRGYGGSEGCGAMFDPGEQDDVAAAVAWADTSAWSNGSVGMYGLSYDAITGVMALAREAPVDAVVLASPVLSYYDALTHDGVHFQSFHQDALRFGLEQVLANPVSPPPSCQAEVAVNDRTNTDPSSPFFHVRDFGRAARGSDVPVLWTRGFWEALQGNNLLPLLTTLTGDVRGSFGHHGHTWSTRHDQFDEEMAFLAHHLDDGPRLRGPAFRVQDNTGRWRGERAWPPSDVVQHRRVLRRGAFVDLPGGDYVAPAADTIWTAGLPTAADVRIAGSASVTFDATTTGGRPGDPHVVVALYDVAADGTATLIARGASLVRGDGETTVDLAAVDWVVRAGHRLVVGMSGSEDSRYEGGTTGATVSIRHTWLTLPLLAHERTRFLDHGLPGGVVVSRPTRLGFDPEDRMLGELPTPRPCRGRSCPAWRGHRMRDATEDVLLTAVVANLQPDPTKAVSIGNGASGFLHFEVPPVDGPHTVTIVADPSRQADIDLRVRDSEAGFVGAASGLDLRREGLVLVDLPPGVYELQVRNIAVEDTLAPTGLPVDVDLTVVLRSDS